MEIRAARGRELSEAGLLLSRAWPAGQHHRIRVRVDRGQPEPSRTLVVPAADGSIAGAAHVSPDPAFAAALGIVVVVAPGHERRGIGSALATEAMDLVAELDGGDAAPLLILAEQLAHGRSFAAGFGFEVVSRSRGWSRAVTRADAEASRAALAAREHLRIRTTDHDAEPALIGALATLCASGVPLPTGETATIDAAAAWPFFFSDTATVLIAEVGGRPAGMTVLDHRAGPGATYVEFTGVDPAVRGAGVATLLKHAQVVATAAAGNQRLFTYSDETNEPMTRLHRAFAFRPGPGYLGLSVPHEGRRA